MAVISNLPPRLYGILVLDPPFGLGVAEWDTAEQKLSAEGWKWEGGWESGWVGFR